jgi:hypothetical protein
MQKSPKMRPNIYFMYSSSIQKRSPKLGLLKKISNKVCSNLTIAQNRRKLAESGHPVLDADTIWSKKWSCAVVVDTCCGDANCSTPNNCTASWETHKSMKYLFFDLTLLCRVT